MSLPLEIANGFSRRPRRLLAGEGMVTPVEPLTLKENGKTEELIPGRHLFIRNYPLVRKHPELFTPADRQDFSTYRHHRRLLERKLEQLGGNPDCRAEKVPAARGTARQVPTSMMPLSRQSGSHRGVFGSVLPPVRAPLNDNH